MVDQVASLARCRYRDRLVLQIFGYDALTALAAIGREVGGIGLGTAVVPTFPRHPVMLAGQALTVQAATGGRLTLGIGLSHQMVIENVFGQSFDKPARHMREYLSILDAPARRRAGHLRGRDPACVHLRSAPDRQPPPRPCWWPRWAPPCCASPAGWPPAP